MPSLATLPAASRPCAPDASARRHDVDWLRVLAFAVLVIFHAAVLFTPAPIPMIANTPPSPAMSLFVTFLHEFRLGLLFLVSGTGVCYALGRRDGPAFVRDRSRRLLIPLVFGVVVLVPPMVFLEKRFNGAFDGDLLDFYLALPSSGIYPAGAVSWHHFWFLAYLFLFCLIAYPLFRSWQAGAGRRRLARRSAWLARGGNLYWVAAVLIGLELLLRPVFPGFRNLVADWASFAHWFAIFVAGYVLAARPALRDRSRDLRFVSLGLGTAASVALFAGYYDLASGRFDLAREATVGNALNFAGFATLRMIAAWAWILTCTGFSARHLNRPSRLLHRLNGAVYPLFCLHLTVIVAFGYLIVPLPWPIAVKFPLIVAGTFVVVFALYAGLIRPLPILHPLFGIAQGRPAPPPYSPTRARSWRL